MSYTRVGGPIALLYLNMALWELDGRTTVYIGVFYDVWRGVQKCLVSQRHDVRDIIVFNYNLF